MLLHSTYSMLSTLKSINTQIAFIKCFKLLIVNVKTIYFLNYLPIILVLKVLETISIMYKDKGLKY